MIPGEVLHTEKLVVRDDSGRAVQIREHSWPEAVDQHLKCATTNAQTLRSQERVTTEKNALRTQLAEMRGHAAQLQDALTEARTEIAEVRSEAHRREKSLHAEYEAKAEATRLKYRTVGTVLPLPRADELASDYLDSLYGIERELPDLARQEGQPRRTYWILRTPDDVPTVPVEVAS